MLISYLDLFYLVIGVTSGLCALILAVATLVITVYCLVRSWYDHELKTSEKIFIFAFLMLLMSWGLNLAYIGGKWSLTWVDKVF